MNGAKVVEYRGEFLKKLRAMLALDGAPNRPERNQGAIEALCAVAGTMFAAKHSLGVEVVASWTIGGAALHGMEEWRKEWNQRN